MAQIQNFRPQAYTRETLVKAIEWLGTQPSAVRERASSADLIVSFYLAALRKASTTGESTNPRQNFKADLKEMAEDLQKLNEPSAPPPTANRSPSQAGTEAAPTIKTPVSTPPARFPSPVRAPEHRTAQELQWTVDERSLELAKEVQERLNLGHEGEAIRLMIQLGCERIRQLFPEP